MHNINKRFYIGTPNELHILQDINLRVQEGEFVSIIGAMGSGKSTLMNISNALDRPTLGAVRSGRIHHPSCGRQPVFRHTQRKIGFVFLSFNLVPETSAQKNIELPCFTRASPVPAHMAREGMLELVELTTAQAFFKRAFRRAKQQRVAIARHWQTTRPSFLG